MISFLCNTLYCRLTMRLMKQWIQNILCSMPLFFMFLIFFSVSFQCSEKFCYYFIQERNDPCYLEVQSLFKSALTYFHSNGQADRLKPLLACILIQELTFSLNIFQQLFLKVISLSKGVFKIFQIRCTFLQYQRTSC